MGKKRMKFDKRLTLIVVIAIFVGIVISTVTVKTLAYTDSPAFCSSCHIMDDVYGSMMSSTHAGISCGDCHLPHDNIVNKLTFKAKSGMSHVYYNTIATGDIPEVLAANDASVEAINSNCISCHESTINNVDHYAKDNCVDCHREVPHGKHFKTKEFFEKPKSGQLIKNGGGFY